MAAEKGNEYAKGNSGGKAMNNRKLAAEVRELTLQKIKVILERPVVEMNAADKELHDALLLKLAPTAMPRITEVTGEDGAPIEVNNAEQKEINSALLTFLNNGTKPPTNNGAAPSAGPVVVPPPVPVHG